MSPTYGQGWGEVFTDLALPSGAVCQIRKLQMEDLVTMGIMDQMDSLGLTVQEQHVERVKGTNKPSDRPAKKLTKAEAAAAEEKQLNDLLRDPKKFITMTGLMDKIIVNCVVQPPICDAFHEVMQEDGSMERERIRPEDRDSKRVYTDSIGIDDKTAIFDFSFSGVQKFDAFREGSGEDVGDVAG